MLRVLGFLLHFGGYYGILYPLILILGAIPLIGAVSAFILIFIAFFFTIVSFIFIIACAWICARPLLALVFFSILFLLMFTGKTARDKMVAEGYITPKS